VRKQHTEFMQRFRFLVPHVRTSAVDTVVKTAKKSDLVRGKTASGIYGVPLLEDAKALLAALVEGGFLPGPHSFKCGWKKVFMKIPEWEMLEGARRTRLQIHVIPMQAAARRMLARQV
jgi:myosin heavy subunit